MKETQNWKFCSTEKINTNFKKKQELPSKLRMKSPYLVVHFLPFYFKSNGKSNDN